MFSEHDVRSILRHPLAAPLRPLQLAQHELRKGGVRPATVEFLAQIGRAMLDDQSADAAPSLRAMDEFFARAAALPDAEQITLGSLRVPARDSHTGQAFDYTVMQAMRDTKANVTCFHKVSC